MGKISTQPRTQACTQACTFAPAIQNVLAKHACMYCKLNNPKCTQTCDIRGRGMVTCASASVLLARLLAHGVNETRPVLLRLTFSEAACFSFGSI
jgi:hypothetical protein